MVYHPSDVRMLQLRLMCNKTHENLDFINESSVKVKQEQNQRGYSFWIVYKWEVKNKQNMFVKEFMFILKSPHKYVWKLDGVTRNT